jgi:hypothetical protein
MSVIDTARSIFLLARRGPTLELQQHILTLREEALALLEENRKLRARVAELEGRTEGGESLSFDRLEGQAEGGESLSFDGTGFWRSKDGKE